MLEESQVEEVERVVALTLHIISLRDRLVSKDSPVHLVN